MAKPHLYRHPTPSEVCELAVAEGHDADIPANIGSIQHVSCSISTCPSSFGLYESGTCSTVAMDKDVEKGESVESVSREEYVLESSAEDPNLVFCDGPDDPQNPLNWPRSRKWGTICLISAITFLTPLASSIFAPGVPQVMASFHSTNDMIEQFMVSVYVLGFAFGPLGKLAQNPSRSIRTS